MATGGIFENLPDGGKYLKADGTVTIESDGLLSSTGFVLSVGAGLTSAGTDLATAYQITTYVAQFGTVAASSAAKLFIGQPIGSEVKVINNGANALLLFPPTATENINGGTAGASVSIAATELAIVTRISATRFDVRIAVVP